MVTGYLRALHSKKNNCNCSWVVYALVGLFSYIVEMDTIFTKIIRGEIPCYKVYEDEHSFAFLDIRPYALGHVLLVSRKPVDHFFELNDPDYIKLFQAAKKLAPAIQKATNSKRVGLVVEGLEVPHVHLKLIPINKAGDLDSPNAHEESTEQMLMIQQKIIDNLNN